MMQGQLKTVSMLYSYGTLKKVNTVTKLQYTVPLAT